MLRKRFYSSGQRDGIYHFEQHRGCLNWNGYKREQFDRERHMQQIEAATAQSFSVLPGQDEGQLDSSFHVHRAVHKGTPCNVFFH